MLQHLEAADGDAELLARLHIVDGGLVHRRHGADRFGGKRGDRQVGNALDQRQGGAGLADRGGGRDAHAGERHLGGALAVDRRIAARRDAVRRGIDQEKADAGAIALSAGKPRRDDEFLRAVAVQHQALGAVDDETRAIAPRAGGDVGEIVARLPLGVREGDYEIAAGDLRDQFGAHRLAAAEPQKSAAEHHGRQIWLKRQRPADLFHDDHGLDRTAGRSAVGFVERQSEQAEFGITRPQRAAETARFLAVALARLERVVIGKQSLDAMLQKPLLVGQRKVHFTAPNFLVIASRRVRPDDRLH